MTEQSVSLSYICISMYVCVCLCACLCVTIVNLKKPIHLNLRTCFWRWEEIREPRGNPHPRRALCIDSIQSYGAGALRWYYCHPLQHHDTHDWIGVIIFLGAIRTSTCSISGPECNSIATGPILYCIITGFIIFRKSWNPFYKLWL